MARDVSFTPTFKFHTKKSKKKKIAEPKGNANQKNIYTAILIPYFLALN